MKWFTRNNQSIPITPKTVRDVSDDNENPITFATDLDDNEKELEEFAGDKKQEFTTENNEPVFETKEEEQIWKEIEDEIGDIEKDKSITLDDKLILLYKIYDEYQNSMPYALAQRMLADISNLDQQLQEIKREEGLKAKESRLHDKIKTLKQRLDEKRMKSRNIPVKSTSDLSTEERKKAESKSHERVEDWEHVASLLLVEAESM